MFPKFFFPAIQGVKDDFVLISHSLTVLFHQLYGIVAHNQTCWISACKRGWKDIVMQFLHHKPLLKEQEKWINPYPPNLHALKFESRAKMITERRFELWKQSHAGYYWLASIAGSARISQYIKKRFTDRTWAATNLKYFNSFIFNIPRKKWINRRY